MKLDSRLGKPSCCLFDALFLNNTVELKKEKKKEAAKRDQLFALEGCIEREQASEIRSFFSEKL